MSFLDELKAKVQGGGTAVKPVEEPAKTSCPLLWELLTQTDYSDGKPRQTASVTFWFDRSKGWCFILHEREMGLKWFGEAAAMQDIPDAMEAALGDPERPPVETPEGRRKREQEAQKQKKVDAKG